LGAPIPLKAWLLFIVLIEVSEFVVELIVFALKFELVRLPKVLLQLLLTAGLLPFVLLELEPMMLLLFVLLVRPADLATMAL